MQWGNKSTQDVSFILRFPSTVYIVVFSMQNITWGDHFQAPFASINNLTVSGFRFQANPTVMGGTRPYIAMGI